MPIKLPVEERFRRKVIFGDKCWEWVGSRNSSGYGYFFFQGKNRRAHRVVYELFVAPIPEGMTIDHLCRNRACVNPDHLEVIPFRENVLRGENQMAKQARQTHCKRGHALSGANLYIIPASGSRACRTCRREWKRHAALNK
jgi:HNH endonuclease